MKLKAVTFIKNGDIKNSHYFYDITFVEAMAKMKEKRIDVIDDLKFNIAIYHY